MLRILVTCLLILLLPCGTAQALSTKSNAERALSFSAKGKWADAKTAARNSKEPVVESLVEWQRLMDENGGGTFSELKGFIEKHPGWPRQNTLLIRAEQTIYRNPPSPKEIIQWLTAHPPQSGRCKKLLAETLLGRDPLTAEDKKRAIALLKDAWINGSFTDRERDELRKSYPSWLDKKVHIEAIEAMLWRGDTRPAKQLLPLVDEDHRKLFTARIRLQNNEKGVDGAIRAVPVKLTLDPGLLYDRMLWRHQRKLDDGVREILVIAPSKVPYPEKWWKIRKQHVRDLLDERQYKQAYLLAKNHGQLDGESFADAEWLAGWIAYSFLRDTGEAYKHFYKLNDKVQYSISKARAAYWAARAAEAHKQSDIAKQWWGMAHNYPGTFYGQLSFASRTHPTSPFPLPADPKPDKKATAAFEKKELVVLIKRLGQLQEYSLAREFILHLTDGTDSPTELALIARLGTEIGRTDHSVRAAKRAMQKNILLRESGFPILRFKGAPIEEALMLAITRQESEFRPDARSPAGALGLMQVLPSTARLVARRNHLNYSVGKLTQSPSFNLQIGTLYLAQLLERFENSYPLAIAAYNAGPSNVDRWIKTYGDPRLKSVDMLTWMESIPYQETRNYVQRVLENLQMYRVVLNDEKSPTLRLQQDMGDVGRK